MSGDLGLKMIGKDPAGLGKGVKTNAQGNLEVKLIGDNMIELVKNQLITAETSFTTEPMEVRSSPVVLGFHWNLSVSSGYKVGVEYLTLNNEVIESEEQLWTPVSTAKMFFEFTPKSPRFRFVISNMHTSNRTLVSLSISTEDIYSQNRILEAVNKSRKRNILLAHAPEVVIPATSSLTLSNTVWNVQEGVALWSSSSSSVTFDLSEFLYIYVVVRVEEAHAYDVEVRYSYPTGVFGGGSPAESEDFEWKMTGIRSNSKWLELSGNRASIRIDNKSDVERRYVIGLMGVR